MRRIFFEELLFVAAPVAFVLWGVKPVCAVILAFGNWLNSF